MNTHHPKLGIMLRTYRARADLTQRGLASIVGCSTRYISKIECGRSIPSLPVLHKIIEALELNDQEGTMLQGEALRSTKREYLQEAVEAERNRVLKAVAAEVLKMRKTIYGGGNGHRLLAQLEADLRGKEW